MDELIYKSAKSIAKAIQDKEVSAVEIVEANLKRIEEVNGKLNAVVQLCADRALDEAREADASLARGESKGALHGVPMTLKDSLDTEGVISTGGTRGRENFVPPRCPTSRVLRSCMASRWPTFTPTSSSVIGRPSRTWESRGREPRGCTTPGSVWAAPCSSVTTNLPNRQTTR